jgi:hypothetical protein
MDCLLTAHGSMLMRVMQFVHRLVQQHQPLLQHEVSRLWEQQRAAPLNHMAAAHALPMSVREFLQLQAWAGVPGNKALKKHPVVAPATLVSSHCRLLAVVCRQVMVGC